MELLEENKITLAMESPFPQYPGTMANLLLRILSKTILNLHG